MSDNPYTEFRHEELTLRDYLAINRTVLANERTFLAYIRTALTIVIAGTMFVKFFDIPLIEITGWVFIFIGIIIFIVGLKRYRKMKNLIDKIKK